jgi:hypothetical protein
MKTMKTIQNSKFKMSGRKTIQNSKFKIRAWARAAFALHFAFFIFNCPLAGAQGTVRMKGADEHKKSVVATNGMVITTNSAKAFTITAQNSSAGDLWLLVFDRSTNALPPNGTAPTLSPLKVPAGSVGFWDWNAVGWQFQNGLIVANSTTDRALTNSSANFWFSVSYDGKAD